MSGVEYIKSDLSEHPECVHGPALLFKKDTKEGELKFFACSACRDRKHCPFFLREGEKYNKELMREKQADFTRHINHEEIKKTLNEVYKLPEKERKYCQTCQIFVTTNIKTHNFHKIINGITTTQLQYPSKWIRIKENDKKEAQYLFSQSTILTIVNNLRHQTLTNVLCIGTPRIHEYIRAECIDMNSLLLDIEECYHHFYKPQEFCWYNLFNHYFFKPEAKKYYIEFLKLHNGNRTVVLIDPPFGGRTEPISETINKINDDHQKIHSNNLNLPLFFFMPYFMEKHITNHIPDLNMTDFKIDYENHACFSSGPKGRKLGSPIRMFTNTDLKHITFPADGYRFCHICDRYVYKENNHCYLCNRCTSKDGSTYIHCGKCNKCVKPSWKHCLMCNKCAQKDNHVCGDEIFRQSCFHCHDKGHKKRECPKINSIETKRKGKTKSNERKKIKFDVND